LRNIGVVDGYICRLPTGAFKNKLYNIVLYRPKLYKCLLNNCY